MSTTKLQETSLMLVISVMTCNMPPSAADDAGYWQKCVLHTNDFHFHHLGQRNI